VNLFIRSPCGYAGSSVDRQGGYVNIAFPFSPVTLCDSPAGTGCVKARDAERLL
jgi:hypothetical protein